MEDLWYSAFEPERKKMVHGDPPPRCGKATNRTSTSVLDDALRDVAGSLCYVLARKVAATANDSVFNGYQVTGTVDTAFSISYPHIKPPNDGNGVPEANSVTRCY